MIRRRKKKRIIKLNEIIILYFITLFSIKYNKIRILLLKLIGDN